MKIQRRTAICIAACALLIDLGASQPARAELSPREYKRMQREASEEVRIEVLGVKERAIPERPREFEIILEAKIVRIERSRARIRDGERIRIVYAHHRSERPRPGPGEIPIPERGRVYPAFLEKVPGEARVFKPVAGAFSFQRIP
jgi:hypothetical protein